MSDDVSAYVEVLGKRDQALKRLREDASYFATVSNGLQSGELRVANSDLSTPLGSPDQYMVDYNTWPDKVKVKERLQEYHNLNSEAKRLYMALPEPVRANVTSPDPTSQRRGGGRTVTF